MLNPQTMAWPSGDGKRIWENGMRSSANQPSDVTLVTTSHTAS